MGHPITYDRVLGPSIVTSGGDQTTTTLTVTSESAPTTVTAANYYNFIAQVSCPGSTTTTTPATAADTLSGVYTLIREVTFSGYALDVFVHTATTPNASTTITVTHQPSLHRIISNEEWYNLSSLEHTISAYTATATANVDVGSFNVGQRHWLVYAVLAIGGSPYSDSISIPADWNLLHDTGTNYGDTKDVRLITCYQITDKRKKVTFKPIISTARIWSCVMFAYKQKI